jgi:ATP-dependent protease ClpP protease subunit
MTRLRAWLDEVPGRRKAPPAPEPRVAYIGCCGPIDSQGVTRVAAALNTAVNERYDRIYLCLTSLGGYVGDGIYLYHHIRSLPVEVWTHNTGSVSSIATIIFVADGRRLRSPHSTFMMHPIMKSTDRGLASEMLQAALASSLKDEARTESILRERTVIPKEVLAGRRVKEVYFSAVEALDYGMVYEIADFALPPGNQIFQV